MLGKNKIKKTAVVYSMGRDGSAAVRDALSACKDVDVRQVYTLDPAKVTAMMLRHAANAPEHIIQSDTLLRAASSSGQAPLHFITMVHEPFGRHVRQCFYQLRHQTADPEALAYSLANGPSMAQFFNAVPANQTTGWFQDEYLPATGIDVYQEPFDHALGYREYTRGSHCLLLLSAHLPREEQTQIVSAFLDVKIPPVMDEISPLDGLEDLFMTHALAQGREKILDAFWYTGYARHFFSAAQIADFQQQMENRAQRVAAMQDAAESAKAGGLRDALLERALSPLNQVQHLTAQIDLLIEKRGADTAMQAAESVLRQLERAHNNVLLAALRSVQANNPARAAALGEAWFARPQDERIIRALAGVWQKNSAVDRPLALLEMLESPDEKTRREKKDLRSQKRLLQKPYPFTPRRRRKPLIAPLSKSILYNAHQSLPFHTSGYATRTHGIVGGLRGCGWDVQVVTRAGYPQDTNIDPQGLAAHDIHDVPYRHDMREGYGQRDLPLEQYIDKAAAYLVKQAQDIRPEIIHTASNYICGLAGIEAARRLGLPSVYEMRGLWHITRWSKEPEYDSTEKFALAQKLELEAARNADRVLAITGALKEWLVDHGIDADKISLAPNAVDLEKFHALRPDVKFARETGCRNKIVIGYIGSFVQYEGLDLLVRALAQLPARHRKKARLLWVGDGPVLGDLLALARELGVAENVVSLGRRPFEDVPRAYSIVDIAAFPRKGQAVCEIVSPLKPFEAMAMEKAVIVSDVRPLEEIIRHGKTGLVHRKDDAASLAEQLARFIEDKDLRLKCGKAARSWIEKTRRWEIIASDIAKVYEGLR